MAQVVIELDDPNMLVKIYKIRRTGYQGYSLETTIPREIFEREARRNDLSFDEALGLLRAVWRYGNFKGSYLAFETVENSEESEDGT